MQDITEHLVQLVRATSTDLSPDVEHALRNACQKEADGSAAQAALETILENVRLSRETGRPICQDTGTPIFYVWHPVGVSQRALGEQIRNAVRIATERAYLRPNAVAALSGKNSGDNTGVDFPRFTSVGAITCASRAKGRRVGGTAANTACCRRFRRAALQACGSCSTRSRPRVLAARWCGRGRRRRPGDEHAEGEEQLFRPWRMRTRIGAGCIRKTWDEVNPLGIGQWVSGARPPCSG